MSPVIPNAITGFEAAFEQFATGGMNGTLAGNSLSPKQGDVTGDNKLDVVNQFACLFFSSVF